MLSFSPPPDSRRSRAEAPPENPPPQCDSPRRNNAHHERENCPRRKQRQWKCGPTARPCTHTGRLIACELKRQRRPVSWLAEKLYCDRSNVYRLLQKSSLDSNLLLRISNILRCDFFAAYSKAYLHELELKTQTQPPKQNRP